MKTIDKNPATNNHLASKIRTDLFFNTGLPAAVFLVLHSLQPAHASPPPEAGRFMKGGVHCFSLRQPHLPQWQETLKLLVQPVDKGKSQAIPLISGLQHGVLVGSSPRFEYISQLTGTASYSLSRDSLMVSLTSNQAGKDLQGEHSGIWIGHIALTLEAPTLSGNAIGSKVFKPVENGKVGQPPFFEDAVDGVIQSINCREF